MEHRPDATPGPSPSPAPPATHPPETSPSIGPAEPAAMISREKMAALLPEKPNLDGHGMATIGKLHVDATIYASFREALAYTSINPETTEIVKRLVDGPKETTVLGINGTGIGHELDATTGNATVMWNPKMMMVDSEGKRHSGAVVLGHELDHADQATHHRREFEQDRAPIPGKLDSREEARATVGWERITSRMLGEPVRNSHEGGAYAPSRDGVTSTDFTLHRSHDGGKFHAVTNGYQQDGKIVEVGKDTVTMQQIRGGEFVTYPTNELRAAMLPEKLVAGENVRVSWHGNEPRAVEIPAPNQHQNLNLTR